MPSSIITGDISLKAPELNEPLVTSYTDGCWEYEKSATRVSADINNM
jgi:hypothetical protein